MRQWCGVFVPPRPVSSVHSSTTVVHNTSAFAGDQSQPIVISDTPSPAVSIITIHSDSEDEDDRKFPAAWWAHFLSVEFRPSRREVRFCWKLICSPLLQLWNKPEDQRDQLRDGARLSRLWLLHQQPPEPQDHVPAHQVSGHHHALCEEPARGEHKPQSPSSSRSRGHFYPNTNVIILRLNWNDTDPFYSSSSVLLLVLSALSGFHR